jgi:hypothetical protein
MTGIMDKIRQDIEDNLNRLEIDQRRTLRNIYIKLWSTVGFFLLLSVVGGQAGFADTGNAFENSGLAVLGSLLTFILIERVWGDHERKRSTVLELSSRRLSFFGKGKHLEQLLDEGRRDLDKVKALQDEIRNPEGHAPEKLSEIENLQKNLDEHMAAMLEQKKKVEEELEAIHIYRKLHGL